MHDLYWNIRGAAICVRNKHECVIGIYMCKTLMMMRPCRSPSMYIKYVIFYEWFFFCQGIFAPIFLFIQVMYIKGKCTNLMCIIFVRAPACSQQRMLSISTCSPKKKWVGYFALLVQAPRPYSVCGLSFASYDYIAMKLIFTANHTEMKESKFIWFY